MNFPKAFVIKGWRVEPQLNRMMREGCVTQLEPRVMQVLCKLAEKPGEVFTRGELLDSVWQGMTVGEEALTRSVSELRKAFEDDPKEPAVIETIYKTGYRLLAEIETDAPIIEEKVGKQFSRLLSLEGNRAPALLAVTVLVVVMATIFLVHANNQEKGNTYADFRLSPLTSLPGEELSPALSPDGKTVVFSWREPGAQYSSLITKSIETGQRSVLVVGEDAHYRNPSWSPSGSAIAFVRKNKSDCEVLRYDMQSRSVDRLTQCNLNSWPNLAWRPDESAIVFSDRKSSAAPYSLFELSLTNASIKQITTPINHIVGDRHAAYSLDGHSLAFLRVKATGISDIYIKSLRSHVEKRITFNETKIAGLSWLNDGGKIVYSSNRRGEWDLWTIDTETRKSSVISVGAETFNFSFSPKAQRIAFEKRSVDTNLWQIDLHDPEAVASIFASSTRWDDDPSFSNSGEQLAFVSDRSGAPEVWVADAETGDVRRLTFFNGGLILRPRWSPNDKEIVFNARVDGNADIYRVNLDTGAISQITQHPAIDAMPEWSNDGNHVLYTSNRSGDWQVWRATASGDDDRQVTTQGGTAPIESMTPNGVLHERPGLSGLWLLSGASPNPVKVVDGYDRSDASRWTVHEGSIFFLEADGGDVILWRYDPLSKEKKRLNVLPNIPENEISNIKLAMTPDGKILTYSKIDARFSDLQLLELAPTPANNTLVAKTKSKTLLQ